MAERKNEEPAPNKAQQKPQGHDTGQSQKSQIAQYFKSQGRQPDDVIWELQGLKLRLKDLE
jgi:hypothetical protein